MMHAGINNRLMPLVRWGAALAAGCWIASAGAATLSCPSSSTLESLVACVSAQMPQDGSNGYAAPTATQRADFRTVFGQMLAGNCSTALPASLGANMQLRTFQDAANGRSYCVLMEVADNDGNGYVDKGWGTFITYANAVREVTHQAPHPKLSTATSGSLGDAYTESEAIRVFKQSDSRGFGMCGARRGANTAASSCQSDSRSSDCAHNTDNLLHASTEQLLAHYGGQDFTVIQWHGMAGDTCQETAYVSHGYAATPPGGAKAIALRDAGRAQLPSWLINTPDTACTLNATDNPQGRLLNGVAAGSVCGTAASASGFGNRFIHIEQDVPALGADLSGVSSAWAQAVVAALPAALPVPAAPTGLTAAPGPAQISLSWSASNGASSYKVKRSTSASGTYTVIATGLPGTRFTDTGLKSGKIYYYYVNATNASGTSANSNQASAQAR